MKQKYPIYDPKLEFSCGCQVLFTLHCPTCQEYLGEDYHYPDEEPKKEEE
jgi:hypothetical protein